MRWTLFCACCETTSRFLCLFDVTPQANPPGEYAAMQRALTSLQIRPASPESPLGRQEEPAHTGT